MPFLNVLPTSGFVKLLGDGLVDGLLGDGLVDGLLGDGVEQLQLKTFCLKESALGHAIPPLSEFLIMLWYLYL